MAKIRVDQSHCNFYLSGILKETGWTIVFTDAGRVSRGGTGSRGLSLAIFERNSYPIPDIVCMRSDTLLLVEVDSRLSIALPSFLKYRAAEISIISEFSKVFDTPLARMQLAFCKTGLTKDLNASVSPPINALILFQNPRMPSFVGIL